MRRPTIGIPIVECGRDRFNTHASSVRHHVHYSNDITLSMIQHRKKISFGDRVLHVVAGRVQFIFGEIALMRRWLLVNVATRVLVPVRAMQKVSEEVGSLVARVKCITGLMMA